MIFDVDPALLPTIQRTIALLRPPPRLTVSQWMERSFVVSEGPEQGPFSFDRAPFLREIVDTYNDRTVYKTAVMKASQVGITVAGLGILFYVVDHDPKNTLMVFPTGKSGEAEKWSKTRLGPALRSNPRIASKFAPDKSRSASNTIMLKAFNGGCLILAGANAPGALASNPCPLVIFEEVARIAQQSGNEGDAQKIAEARASLFWDRFFFGGGSPTVKHICPSEREFDLGDQRYYMVPCPECKEPQKLTMGGPSTRGGIKWTRDADGVHHTESAYYECCECRARWNDPARWKAIMAGQWRPTAVSNGVASFHISQLYSMFITAEQIATKFVNAVAGGPETLQPFVNTVLGETWEQAEGVTISDISRRLEQYDPSVQIPAGVAVITAGVDVQDDRFEIEVVGWGAHKESWSLAIVIIPGDPRRPEMWEKLRTYLVESRFHHPHAGDMHIGATCVDSGGHHTHEVYRFCYPLYPRNIWPVKGSSIGGRPIIGPPTKVYLRNPAGVKTRAFVRLYPVGADTAKDWIYSALAVTAPGPQYCHFPRLPNWDENFFAQLTSERKVPENKNGRPSHRWVLPKGRRNEGLDRRVYALAALVNSGADPTAHAAAIQARARAATGNTTATTRPAQTRRAYKPITKYRIRKR